MFFDNSNCLLKAAARFFAACDYCGEEIFRRLRECFELL